MVTIPVSQAWLSAGNTESIILERTASSCSSRRYSIVCICQAYNELSKETWSAVTSILVNALVVYDDGSTDGSYEYMLQQTPYVIRGIKNDFVNERSHKQRLLEEALKLSPDFILWLDADEVLTAHAAEYLQALCAMCEEEQVDGVVFHEINLWRSNNWRRVDSLYDAGWFVRLWRVTPGMRYEETSAGLHQRPYPDNIKRIQWTDAVKVLHYGFSTKQRLAHKYLTYQAHGQRAMECWTG